MVDWFFNAPPCSEHINHHFHQIWLSDKKILFIKKHIFVIIIQFCSYNENKKLSHKLKNNIHINI